MRMHDLEKKRLAWCCKTAELHNQLAQKCEKENKGRETRREKVATMAACDKDVRRASDHVGHGALMYGGPYVHTVISSHTSRILK
jgi:predicted metal-binding protein